MPYVETLDMSALPQTTDSAFGTSPVFFAGNRTGAIFVEKRPQQIKQWRGSFFLLKL